MFCAFAASAENEYLKIELNDGTVSTVAVGDIKEMTFRDGYTMTASINGRVLSSVSNVEYRDYYDIAAGTVKVEYPAYTLWKLSVSQNLTRYIKVSLAVDNIFNYKPLYYYLNCSLTDGTAFMAGVSIDFY